MCIRDRYQRRVHGGQKTRKGRTKISKHSVTILRNWFTEHFDDPYPKYHEKIQLASKTGMSVEQVQNWFTNARVRNYAKNNEKFSEMVKKRFVEARAKTNYMFNDFFNMQWVEQRQLGIVNKITRILQNYLFYSGLQ
eukprot:TRINITY_DN8951_c0_g1_i4.p1 TRINITY_DN8951_c0_g1~~TRINITY_DN8951_c0_g1_i4.p1  ORF type:complete len:137 (-),score=12.03 TRINITY_DN8951_c0_g1_i4:783-1193(-)